MSEILKLRMYHLEGLIYRATKSYKHRQNGTHRLCADIIAAKRRKQ